MQLLHLVGRHRLELGQVGAELPRSTRNTSAIRCRVGNVGYILPTSIFETSDDESPVRRPSSARLIRSRCRNSRSLAPTSYRFSPSIVREPRVRRDGIAVLPGTAEHPGVLVIGAATCRETPKERRRTGDAEMGLPTAPDTKPGIAKGRARTARSHRRTRPIEPPAPEPTRSFPHRRPYRQFSQRRTGPIRRPLRNADLPRLPQRSRLGRAPIHSPPGALEVAEGQPDRTPLSVGPGPNSRADSGTTPAGTATEQQHDQPPHDQPPRDGRLQPAEPPPAPAAASTPGRSARSRGAPRSSRQPQDVPQAEPAHPPGAGPAAPDTGPVVPPRSTYGRSYGAEGVTVTPGPDQPSRGGLSITVTLNSQESPFQ